MIACKEKFQGQIWFPYKLCKGANMYIYNPCIPNIHPHVTRSSTGASKNPYDSNAWRLWK